MMRIAFEAAWRVLLSLVLIAVALDTSPPSARAQNSPKLSPYPAIRWAPEVQIDGRWYSLRSINDLPITDIIAFARNQYEDSWEKRVGEDLVQVLCEMGDVPGPSVKLVVQDLETGQVTTLDRVPLTAENRQAIMDYKRLAPVANLRPEALRRALDEFSAALNERWSYRRANEANFDAAIDVLRKKIDAGIAPNDFGIELHKILALGIDGHSVVSGYFSPAGGYLPCLIESEDARFIAFKPDRSGFLADGFPYVVKIDGRDIADWCRAAEVFVPKGSPQYIRRQCLRRLRDVDHMRSLMGLPKSGTVEIELSAVDGNATKTVVVPVAARPPLYGEWPQSNSRILVGNVGYLRLPSMTASTSVGEIKKWMPEFRNTAGLIIDVRDNGGGDRDALLQLHSYLAAPDAPPRVFTAAAYRLHREHTNDHLAQRFMYRADSEQWTAKERQAIAEFAKTFKPTWSLPEGQFSEWHYMVLSRQDDPSVFHYAKPVVVLMNEKCFSATDIFLAGLKGLPNVMLMGSPSGGGSALAQEIKLGSTPFSLRIGSIASFQADGKLFDGYGVQPDVVIHPNPEYFIGGRDRVFDEAIKRIQSR
jgi:hypothetical protein